MARKRKYALQDKETSVRPDTEQRLFDLQKGYLHDRNETDWAEFYALVHIYSRSIVLKINRNKISLPPERVDELANDTACSFLENYTKRPDFKVDSSFGGMIKWKALNSLYKDKNNDWVVSLNDLLFDNIDKEVQDEQNKMEKVLSNSININQSQNGSYLNDESVGTIQEEVNQLFNEYYTKGVDYHEVLTLYCYILLILRKPKNRKAVENFKQKFVPEEYQVNFDLFLLEVMKRLSFPMDVPRVF